jgi:hypothetical protein
MLEEGDEVELNERDGKGLVEAGVLLGGRQEGTRQEEVEALGADGPIQKLLPPECSRSGALERKTPRSGA